MTSFLDWLRALTTVDKLLLASTLLTAALTFFAGVAAASGPDGSAEPDS